MTLPVQKILTVILLCCSSVRVAAQDSPGLTLVYDISIVSENKHAGIEETYNGGIKTIMQQNNKTRMRLVSLMRIQSIFFTMADSVLQGVVIAKESGQKKYKYRLSASAWQSRNAKYNDATHSSETDSTSILGYMCKKTVITLTNGRQITAYYAPGLKPLHKSIEPMFAGIDGLVLQYAYQEKNGKITYTASHLSFNDIEEDVFKEPAKGYIETRPGR